MWCCVPISLLLMSISLSSCLALALMDQCMELFEKEREAFDPCVRTPCFLFNEQAPYVIVNRTFTNRRPFSCKLWKEEVSNAPKGLFFELVDSIPMLQNALCIFAGSECTFDELVRFLPHAHRTGRRFQFVVGGVSLLLSYPMSECSIPSAAISNSPIVVAGTYKKSFNFDVILEMIEALTLNWVLVFTMLSVGLFLSIWCLHMEKTFIPSVLRMLRNLFLLLVLLFYQIHIANYIFTHEERSRKDLYKMNEREMNEFVLIRGSSYEQVFRRYVDPLNRYADHTPPWQRANSSEQLFDSLLYHGMVSMLDERHLLYNLEMRSARKRLQVYKTNMRQELFPLVWYYSVDVPLRFRLGVDLQILKLREKDKIRMLFGRAQISHMSMQLFEFLSPFNVIYIMLFFIIMPIVSFFSFCRNRYRNADTYAMNTTYTNSTSWRCSHKGYKESPL